MKLVGANPSAAVTGTDELPGKSNYFIGNDSKKWRTNVPNFGKVKYAGVYPGVDLIYYGNQRQLEYDFVVAPGADPKAIMLDVEAGLPRHLSVPPGSSHYRSNEDGSVKPPLRITADGNLVVNTDGGEVRFHKPIVYQTDASSAASSAGSSLVTRHSSLVDGRYVLNGKHEISFEVATYDHTKPLVIDPVLSYSTYLGGSVGEFGNSIAVDTSGNAYVTGYTSSTNFPILNPYQGSNHGGPSGVDAFVAKLNAAGSALVYATYLGGSANDYGYGIAVDSSGNAYLTGLTFSTDFPHPNAFQAACNGGSNCDVYGDAFVAELNAAGSALVYSTFLGGSAFDSGHAIAVDSSGSAYVIGSTQSATDFPTVNPLQGSSGGDQDAFVAKINPGGSMLIYSTYLGGSGYDVGQGIALDSSGNAYVIGTTNSMNFPTAPTPNPLQASRNGPNDVFVAKLNEAGSVLVYSTYLGGSGSEGYPSIAVDTSGSAYVTGYTSSNDFPTVNPLQASNHGGKDAFVAKLNAAGSALVYSTYLGGSSDEYGLGIAVDSAGNVYVAGQTSSNDFPTLNPLQATNHGAFVAQLNAVGSALVYSTYLGGNTADWANGIAVDSSGDAYVVGVTQSTDFPSVNPLQATNHGGQDAFVAKIGAADTPGVAFGPGALIFGDYNVGTSSNLRTITLTDAGSELLTITSISIKGANPGDFTQTNTCGTLPATLAGGANCTLNLSFSPKARGMRTANVTVKDNAAGSPQTAALSGLGTEAIVKLTPTSLTFPTQLVSTTSNPKTVTLMNTGNATLNITSVASSGDFSQTNTCGSSVGAGLSCTFTIRFTPTAAGTRTGSVSITDDAPMSPQMIHLTGTGTIVTVSPKSVNFGRQKVGTTSSVKSVTVTNASTTTTLNISGITIGGTNPGDFAIDPSSTCPATGGTLGPSSACSINLKFTPAATGMRKATVSISDDGGASPQIVTLSGTGT